MRLLDLYCGAGGCSYGYWLTGHFTEIVGVDLHPQPNYPFTFVQADALTFPLEGYDVIHASPPCQAHTPMSNRWRGQGGKADDRLDLIPATRARLLESGLPYVIENVTGARRSLWNPILLRGRMFGLGVDRPRYFESNVNLRPEPPYGPPIPDPVGVYGKAPDGRHLFTRSDGTRQHAASSLAEAQEAMGIDWMDWRELAESIPPPYTEWIGHRLLERGLVSHSAPLPHQESLL